MANFFKRCAGNLGCVCEVQLIDPKALLKRIVRIPQMTEYLDEWTQRKQKAKNSRAALEQTPAQSKSKRIEKEAEAESQRKEKAVAAAAALLNKKTEDHWRALEIVPCGSIEFQEIWGTIWGKQRGNHTCNVFRCDRRSLALAER